MRKSLKTGLSTAGLLVVLVGLIVGSAGAATYSSTVANQTVAVDDSTSSVYAELNNTDDTSVNASVEYYGIDSGGNETKVATHNLSVGAGNTSLDKFQSVNSTKYGSYRVVVSVQNETNVDPSNVSATIGTFEKVASGGGGGLLSGSGSGTIGIVVAVLVVLGLLKGKDD